MSEARSEVGSLNIALVVQDIEWATMIGQQIQRAHEEHLEDTGEDRQYQVTILRPPTSALLAAIPIPAEYFPMANFVIYDGRVDFREDLARWSRELRSWDVPVAMLLPSELEPNPDYVTKAELLGCHVMLHTDWDNEVGWINFRACVRAVIPQ